MLQVPVPKPPNDMVPMLHQYHHQQRTESTHHTLTELQWNPSYLLFDKPPSNHQDRWKITTNKNHPMFRFELTKSRNYTVWHGCHHFRISQQYWTKMLWMTLLGSPIPSMSFCFQTTVLWFRPMWPTGGSVCATVSSSTAKNPEVQMSQAGSPF